MFADDTSMYLCLDNDDLCAEILNSDLEKINILASKCKVTFNSTKTELMNVSPKKRKTKQKKRKKQQLRTLPLKFENTLLTAQEQHKHLGVILQHNCKWDEHY